MSLLTQEQYDRYSDELVNIEKIIKPALDRQVETARKNNDIESIKDAIRKQNQLTERVKFIGNIFKKDLEVSGK